LLACAWPRSLYIYIYSIGLIWVWS
jgi:hypothetical protein